MKRIVLTIRRGEEDGVSAFRNFPGLEAADGEGLLWLRAPADFPWRLVPCEGAWQADAEHRLFPFGKTVPEKRLPELKWRPAAEALPVQLPVSRMPARKVRPVVVRPERTDAGPAPAFLRLPWQAWRDYALEAPLVRLRHWYFLRTAENEAFVMGAPVPPLPGFAYGLQAETLLVPEGWLFRSEFELDLLKAKLEAEQVEPSLYLFGQDGVCERIPARAFVPATRSAIRATDQYFKS